MAAKKKLPPWLQKGDDDADTGAKRMGKPAKRGGKKSPPVGSGESYIDKAKRKKVGAGQAVGVGAARKTPIGEAAHPVPSAPRMPGADPYYPGTTPEEGAPNPLREPRIRKLPPGRFGTGTGQAKKKVGAGQSTGTAEVPALLAEAHGPARKRKENPTGVEGTLRRRAIKGGAAGRGAD